MEQNREQYAKLLWTNYSKLVDEGMVKMRFDHATKNIIRDWIATFVLEFIAILDVVMACQWLSKNEPATLEFVLVLAIAIFGVALSVWGIRGCIKETKAEIQQLCNYTEVKIEIVKDKEKRSYYGTTDQELYFV